MLIIPPLGRAPKFGQFFFPVSLLLRPCYKTTISRFNRETMTMFWKLIELTLWLSALLCVACIAIRYLHVRRDRKNLRLR